ncbi:MAG: NUDIX domain-containing protein [Gammaproteobacteria bacterium]|nr:NUDIX domain-containing protein [Gammaproteobacteria bacterium]
MTHEVQIHDAQTAILRALLFTPEAGFAELQKPTKLETDHFKFHIARLVELDYVNKIERGRYALTIKGKEYSNKLDTDTNTIERQPKVSVVLILKREQDGRIEYLCQQRLKNPYFGFWGRLGGKVSWGESFEETATRELKEETGLDGEFEFKSIYRKRDYRKGTDELLEDKIFVIMRATHYSGELIEHYEGGLNQWMTQDELASQEKSFESAVEFVDVIDSEQPYVQKKHFYDDSEY